MLKYTWLYTKIWYGICGAFMTMLMVIQPLNFAVALVMWKVITALTNWKKMYMKDNTYATSTTWDMRLMTNNDGITPSDRQSGNSKPVPRPCVRWSA